MFAAQDVGNLRSFLPRLERLMSGEDFVAGEQKFDRLSGLKLAAFVRGVLDLQGQRLELLDFVREIVKRLGDLIKSRHLILEMPRATKSFDEPLSRGRGCGQQNNRLGLLGGQLIVSIRLEFLFRHLPPLLEEGGIENLWRKRGSDLIHTRLPAMIAKNLPHQRHRILLGLPLYAGRIGELASKNMVRRNGLESLCRVRGLHKMAFLGLKIDDDLTGEQAPLGHATESPALVQTTGPGFELGKGFGCLRRKLSGFDGLLKFFVHVDCFRLICLALQGPREFAHANPA